MRTPRSTAALCAFALLVALAACSRDGAAPPTDPAATTDGAVVSQDASTPVRIVSRLAPGKCLDASRGSATSAAQTVLATCSDVGGQRFTMRSDGSIATYDGAMCLDASGGRGNDGDAIIIWPCKGSTNQLWRHNSVGEIVGINGKCVDIRRADTADGTPIILWSCHGGTNQQWDFVALDSPPASESPTTEGVTLSKVSGDRQTATYGTRVAAPLVVVARDAAGQPVSGVSITWKSADGTPASATSTTDSNGSAQIALTVSRTFFTTRVSASAGESTVTFTATGNGTPSLGGRRPFPSSNAWNTDISAEPVDPNSAALIASCGAGRVLHPDFGTVWNGAPNGIPFIVVHGSQARVPVSFRYASESDPGPYPIPSNAPIQGGSDATGDRHVIVVDWDDWKVYEMFSARTADGGASWTAGSGAIFDFETGTLRPAGWTSADAAGLPILPGLVRYDEVKELGAIQHALRMSCDQTRNAYIAPARHAAGSGSSADLPPMGMRVRLKKSVDISRFSASNQVILRALQRYGAFVADNGAGFMISGAPDPRWSDSDLHNLQQITASDFEVVRMGAATTMQ
ncbi:MAG TPA: ricin-type beta-trefoil lectin domain protein [Gemmatimonadaceae bacterium]